MEEDNNGSNTEVTIEKTVPMPRGTGRAIIYPWDEMEVGDSFFYPTDDDMTPMKRQNSVFSSVAYYRTANRLTNDNYGITTRRRTENGVKGVRVWRCR